jgi:serine/threonine protein kinase
MNPASRDTRPAQSLQDATLDHLRSVVDVPDVSGTRYELVEIIGRGGMGTVWRALDRLLEREVALKVLDEPDAELGREMGIRLVQEAKVLARLEHPGIVPVHDVGVFADGRTFTCMKLVRGQRLDEMLAANTPESERLSIFARIAESVAFAHAGGVLHLDLKPANVMVGEFGEVLVLDWGLARLQRAAESTPAFRAGTEGFMSPEQKRGDAHVDARSDVFALGRLLAELRIGGREIAAIVAKATAELPSGRYATVIELAADARRFQAGLEVRALPDSPWTKLARFHRKYRAAIWLVAAYAIMRIGFELFRSWRESGNS